MNHRSEMLLNPEQVTRCDQISSIGSQIFREHRCTNPIEYRHNVYRHGIWTIALPDIFGRFCECIPEFYK
jgi:hypothetical protein